MLDFLGSITFTIKVSENIASSLSSAWAFIEKDRMGEGAVGFSGASPL